MPTIDEYAEQRNEIQLDAESMGKEFADRVWLELGVANRHITRVIEGVLPLRIVETEIEQCLRRVRKTIEEKREENVNGNVPSNNV